MDLNKIDNDFSEEEVERINTFVSNGSIGLDSLVQDEHKVNAIFGLYMAGKTYTEISKISKVLLINRQILQIFKVKYNNSR